MKLVVTAPTRISLFGGGTDIPVFYEKYGGLVISMAINIRQRFWLEFNERVKGNVQFVYPQYSSPIFYDSVLKFFDSTPTKFVSEFEGKFNSGLGSSASALVALTAALSYAKGIYLTKAEIAERAWDIEVNKLNLFGGKQDQYRSANGGFGTLEFQTSRDAKIVKPQIVDNSWPKFIGEFWSKRLMLFFIGKTREDPKVQDGLKKLTAEKALALLNIKQIAEKAQTVMYLKDVSRTADLLNESWEAKKKSNSVTNEQIDKIYDLALKSGALAGKLNGSGQGGFMTFLVEPDKQNDVRRALQSVDCIWYNFDIDHNGVEVREIPE